MNALGTLPLSIAVAFGSRPDDSAAPPLRLAIGDFDKMAIFVVGVSCFIGIALSHYSMHLRAQVSGTAFLVVGHSCKIITIVLNVLIWDKHASIPGLCALGIC